jgi:hypothetical protein
MDEMVPVHFLVEIGVNHLSFVVHFCGFVVVFGSKNSENAENDFFAVTTVTN